MSDLGPRRAAVIALAILGAFAGCGKKGPPLAPLNMAPEAPQGVTARRLGDTVYLQLTVPAKSASGTGPYSVDHLEVYAVTLAPGAMLPPNRDLLKPAYVVAKIPVRKPVDPNEEAEPAEKPETNTRPAPGDVVAFVETITPALLEPQTVSKPVVEPARPAGAPATPPSTVATPPGTTAAGMTPGATVPGAPAAAAAPAALTELSRVYTVRAVAANGARGPAGARAMVPLVAAPPRARAGSSSFDQSSVTFTWAPPPVASDEAPGVSYNVYVHAVPAAGSGAAGAPVTAPVPLNPKPIEETTYTHAGAVAGKEQCFVVRTVATVGTQILEGDPSDPICVTPADTFPPAPPKGLAAVAGTGVINLIWDANTDADLGGYLVLRGEAPGDTLQPLTPAPIRETRYVDRSVRAGVTYIYAILAVDRATTPNRSALSNRVQETAR